MKWGIDSAWRGTQRSGPIYSMRPCVYPPSKRVDDPVLKIHVFPAFNASKPIGPSFSMGPLLIGESQNGNVGPGHYTVQSTMDPGGHPVIPKHRGAQMGCGVLAAIDEPSPAPGDYDAEAFKKSARIKRSASWTALGREAWAPRSEAPGPTPGEYSFDHCEKTGKKTPFRWSFGDKLEPVNPPRGTSRIPYPGPHDYKPPGHIGAKCQYPNLPKPPGLGFGSLPRGLL